MEFTFTIHLGNIFDGLQCIRLKKRSPCDILLTYARYFRKENLYKKERKKTV